MDNRVMLRIAGGPGGPDDPQVEQWNRLKQKYAGSTGALDRRMDWINWANKQLPTSGTPAQLSSKAAKYAGIDPGMLLASSLEEGVGLRFKGPSEDISNAYDTANQKGELKGFPVDAYRSYGLDQIGGRADEFIKKGYLPSDFKSKMKPFNASNEIDERNYYQKAYNAIKQYQGLGNFKYSNDRNTYDKIDKILDEFEVEGVTPMATSAKTAAFKDDESAYLAKAAFLRSEQDELQRYAKQKGYKLTPEEQKFFTMASYNGGAGNGRAMLDYYAQKKLLGNNGFLKDRGNKGQIYDNIMPRYVGSNLFNNEGYFVDKEQPKQSPSSKIMVRVAK